VQAKPKHARPKKSGSAKAKRARPSRALISFVIASEREAIPLRLLMHLRIEIASARCARLAMTAKVFL
jgi:hypothetical protein